MDCYGAPLWLQGSIPLAPICVADAPGDCRPAQSGFVRLPLPGEGDWGLETCPQWVCDVDEVQDGDGGIGLGSIRKGDWMFSIDLKGAYFQINIHPDSRSYLRLS